MSFFKYIPPTYDVVMFFFFSFAFFSGYNRNFIRRPVRLDETSPLPGRGVIDAQTYVDVQSNGLTQRIVRYDEENKKTPSSIFNRAYKRPGDFPIVHLQKPKLVLTPQRSLANPSKMARIGQPDPSINRTNIRAEILRNGTMMPPISVDRREDVDSGVRVDPLDALKEISRKRIHCEVSTRSILLLNFDQKFIFPFYFFRMPSIRYNRLQLWKRMRRIQFRMGQHAIIPSVYE